MRFAFDNAIEYPAYLRDTKTSEVWEFRNSAELQTLETDIEISDGTYDGFDSGRRILSIRVDRVAGKISIRRSRECIDSARFSELTAVAVW